MNKEQLKKNYEKAVEDYTRAFLNMYNIGRYDAEGWVAMKVGGIYFDCDLFFNFDEIKYCVDNSVDWHTYISWYEYVAELGLIDTSIATPNLNDWCHGYQPRSEEEIEKLRKAMRDRDEAEESLRKAIHDFKVNEFPF